MQHRTPFIVLILAGIFAVLLSGCDPQPQSVNSTDGASVFYGGTIITMEADQPEAEAVVSGGDGRIVFVGDRQAALSRYPDAQEIDLQGKTLMPGFIEQHLHPFLGALTLSIAVIAPEAWELPDKTWPAVVGEDEYLAALTRVEQGMEDDGTDEEEILWSWGFNQYFHGELSREILDSISDTRPIAVWHRSAHEFYLNSAFVERFGINQQDIDATGTEAASQTNLARGHFYEAGAMLYLLPIIFPALGNEERFRSGLAQMVEMLHRKGVTAYMEPGAFIPAPMVNVFTEILGAESTPMYSFFVPESKTPFYRYGEEGVLAEVERIAQTFGDDTKVRFLDKQVKLLFDGAIISQLMQMQDGYVDGHVGEWIQPPEEVEKIIRIFWEAGYQIHIHILGDLALEKFIAILQERMAEQPREDHRTTIVHFATSNDEQVRRLGELGAIISANPYYVTGFGEKFGELGLGAERAHAMVRLGTAEEEGISISLHSDMPMAPSDPLFLAWSATTRRTNEGTTLRPDLALSREAALRAITIDAAYSWRMEDTLGSIREGKVANFTILELNPYAVALDQLKDIPVTATVFEGRMFPITP